MLERWLKAAPPLVKLERLPRTDAQVAGFIRRRRATEPDATASRLLREFRDLGFACEQRRFASIYHALGRIADAPRTERPHDAHPPCPARHPTTAPSRCTVQPHRSRDPADRRHLPHHPRPDRRVDRLPATRGPPAHPGDRRVLNSDEVIFPNPIILALSSGVRFTQSRGPKVSDGFAATGTVEIPSPTARSPSRAGSLTASSGAGAGPGHAPGLPGPGQCLHRRLGRGPTRPVPAHQQHPSAAAGPGHRTTTDGDVAAAATLVATADPVGVVRSAQPRPRLAVPG